MAHNNEGDVTINDLARMVQKGFEETATKKDLEELRKETREGFERLENILIEENRRRIEKLEDQMMEVRNLLAMRNGK